MRGVKLTPKEIEDNVLNKIKSINHKVELISIKYLNDYIKASNAVLVLRCSDHNKIEEVSYYNFMNYGWNCEECRKINNRSDKLEIENRINNVLEKSNKLGTDLKFSKFCDDEWTGYTGGAKVEIKCNKHNTITNTLISNLIIRGKTDSDIVLVCPECRKEFNSLQKRRKPEDAVQLLKDRFPESIYDFSKVQETYETEESDVIIVCPIHGEFTKIYKYLIGSSDPRCPHCYEEHLLSRYKSDGSYSLISKQDALKLVSEIIKEKNRDSRVNIEFIGFVNNEWIGIKSGLILKCNNHNILWDTTSFDTLRKDKTICGCPECKKEINSLRLRKSSDEALQLAIEAQNKRTDGRNYNLNKIADTYKSYNKNVTITCEKHGDFDVIYSTLLDGRGMCPNCYLEFISEIQRMSEEEGISRINNRIAELKKYDVDIDFMGYVVDNTVPITYRKLILHCNKHNVTWNTTSFVNFTKDKIAAYCPVCSAFNSSSLMENLCYSILIDTGLNIERQFEIILDDDIKNFINHVSGKIKSDFYIKDLQAIIEYNGGQHYQFTPYYHSLYSDFIDQVNRDEFLRRYCKENNIKLLIIPYKDDKRIPEIIEKFIKEGTDITTKVEVKPLPPAIYQETCRSLIKLGDG